MFSAEFICGPEEKPQPFWNGFKFPEPQNRSGFRSVERVMWLDFFSKQN
jgi:hypothetical protein